MKVFKHFELVFWIIALASLALSNPGILHFSLCPLSNLGFSWCPGCGLGRSITSVFQGNFKASFEYHWFGVPTLLILFHRIFVLSKKYFLSF